MVISSFAENNVKSWFPLPPIWKQHQSKSLDTKGLGPAATNQTYNFREVLFPLLALFSSIEFIGPDYEVPISNEYRAKEMM